MLTRTQNSSHVHDTVLQNAVHHPNGSVEYRCPYHGPMWGNTRAPRHPCEYCWCMYFMLLDAAIPSDKRGAAREELLRAMIQSTRDAERGNFDIVIDRHPKVEIDLEAEDPAPPAEAEPLNLPRL